jgi:hypothetical protein
MQEKCAALFWGIIWLHLFRDLGVREAALMFIFERRL